MNQFEGEIWITEVIHQFRQLLVGKSTKFSINLTDGNKFVGKLMKTNLRALRTEGRYILAVKLKNEEGLLQGYVDFVPSPPETPDLVQYVLQGYVKKGREIEFIEVKERRTKRGRKQWSIVFFAPFK